MKRASGTKSSMPVTKREPHFKREKRKIARRTAANQRRVHGSFGAVRFAQQLTRNLGLRRGIVLGDDGLILLDRLIAAARQIIHLSGCQLGALLEVELTVGYAGGELVILERTLIVLLAAQALCQSEGGKFDARSGVLSCFR